MSSLSKVFLTLAAIAVVGVLLVGGGAWFWWNHNGADMLEAGKVAIQEGQRSGTELTESSCVSTSMDRHKAGANSSFSSALRNNLWLTGCLNASKPQEQFCAGVPRQDEILTMAMWSAQKCAQSGIEDSTCPNLLQSIAKYCASPQRAEKLKENIPPARQRGTAPIA
jgi:hypothetical protein